jgi:hypothetical protein
MDWYDMSDTPAAMCPVETCSLRAVTVIMGRFCTIVSPENDNAAIMGKRAIVVIAGAKVRKNN